MAISFLMNIFLLALPFFLFILLKHTITKNGNNYNLPPSPPSLPLIGHLHLQLFDNSVPHIFFHKLSQKYGPIMFLRLGFRPTLIVSSAKMAEEVMKTHDLDFCSRPNLRGARKFSYDSSDLSYSPYTEYWKEMRKICGVHLFGRVQKFRPVREDEAARLVERVCRLCVDSKAVNLSEAMMCFSSSIICRVGFGKRYDDEGTERSRFHVLLRECEALFFSFNFSDYLPFMAWADRLTGFHARLERTFKELDTFYQELIDEHLDPNRPKPQHEDIIDVLLRIRTDGDFPFDLTTNHIKAILMDMLVAGTDTTASTVIWVMTFLMKNPKHMKKTQDQVRNLIGKKGFVNEDDVQGLTYLNAVIKETFRLQPTAPLLVPRETLRNCNIGGHQVPAKTLVYVNTWSIGRDVEAWENPEEFCPERFIDSSIDYKGMNFELLPFGAGRRACPGMRMGVLAVELALANLLYGFDWEMPTETKEDDLDFDVTPGITTHKKNDLILVARNISD